MSHLCVCWYSRRDAGDKNLMIILYVWKSCKASVKPPGDWSQTHSLCLKHFWCGKISWNHTDIDLSSFFGRFVFVPSGPPPAGGSSSHCNIMCNQSADLCLLMDEQLRLLYLVVTLVIVQKAACWLAACVSVQRVAPAVGHVKSRGVDSPELLYRSLHGEKTRYHTQTRTLTVNTLCEHPVSFHSKKPCSCMLLLHRHRKLTLWVKLKP